MQTASIALYYVVDVKQHYLQIITADQQNHYFLTVSPRQARVMAVKDNLSKTRINTRFWED